MCGIIGYIGPGNSVSIVLKGLKRLEYRGYDSAGIAFLEKKEIKLVRCPGKIKSLERLLGNENAYESNLAIGHTRWATHGKPSEENAHPHKSGSIALVHNGIVENYIPLKKGLQKEGYEFSSETDTEVICHLINKHSRKLSFIEAVKASVRELKGAYALAIMSETEPGTLIGVRKDSPLVLGIGEGEFYLASDVSAFLSYTKKVIFLDDDELVIVGPSGYKIMNSRTGYKDKSPVEIPWTHGVAEKSGYRHFMLKEIHEQPIALADTMRGRINAETGEVNIQEFQGLTEETLRNVTKVIIGACGTSWHAGLAGKYMMESMARVPVELEIASEFRYKDPIIKGGELFIAITQSGETADTLAAQRLAKKLGVFTLSISNVIGSSSAREADAVFFTRSGPEIGVAATKTFTAQLTSLYIFSVALARVKGAIDLKTARNLLRELLTIPNKIETVLGHAARAEEIAKKFFSTENFLFLGRGINYPIAMEGALKLKEISYVHAEGYPAGEMKHGPIALIDKDVPVLFLVPSDAEMRAKILSNMEEVRSRNASIIAVTDEEDPELEELAKVFVVPRSNGYLTAILMVVPLQLLAYHIGVLRGCDVDQPRNLAKSVTVE